MFKKHPREQSDGSIDTDYEPWLSFRWGRNVSWFKVWRNAGRTTVWTRFFALSFGDRFTKDDGWPQ